MTEEINKGCEFQSDCIEYKDISYLKVMPICAVHELSIVCHDKVNKCKYYKLYKQLGSLEQENKELKEKAPMKLIAKNNNYRSALEEINITVKQLLQGVSSNCINNTPYLTALSLIETKINEVLQ